MVFRIHNCLLLSICIFPKSYNINPGPNNIPCCAMAQVNQTLHKATTNLINEEGSCSYSYSEDEDGDELFEL